MKKFYYLATGIVMILVTIMACEKSAIGVDETLTLPKEEVSARAEKSDICHFDKDSGEYFIISIADAAYDNHIAHGDRAPITYFRDSDGDGFGDASASFTNCEKDIPIGYVADNTDCDDNKAAVLGEYIFEWAPGANGYKHYINIDTYSSTEKTFSGSGHYILGSNSGSSATYNVPCTVQGTIDLTNQTFKGTLTYSDAPYGTHPFPGNLEFGGSINGCNGLSLEGSINIYPFTALVYAYVDGDSDLYYDNVDCEDGEFDINPGAVEICGDGIDNNCNDLIDEECGTDFIAFYIRNNNSITGTAQISAPWDYDMLITENAAGNGFSCATPRGGQKVGYGTNAFDGMQVNTIETVNWDKLAGKIGLFAYMNMWVTDGTNYAIISSENAYLGTDFRTRGEWKIFETNMSNLNWLFASGTGTQGTTVTDNQYLMKDGSRATLSDLGDNIILGDPGVYLSPIGTGAPRGGFGFNLIWGDTRENFIGEGYSLENVSVTIAGVTYEASN